MAQVPYGQGIPEVAPDARPPDDYQHIEPNPAAFGGAIAQGLQQSGAGATKAATFFGQVAADSGANDYQDRVNKILHGDPNKTVIGPDGKPQQDLGYLGLKGRAALDARPEVEKQLDEELKNVRASLQTPEQQLQFDNFSRRYRSFAAGQVGSHADTQANTWYAEVNKSSVQLGLTHIANNPNDPNEVAAGAADVIHALTKEAQLQGAQPGDELWTRAEQNGRQVALKTQVQAIAVKDPARAKAILDKNKDIVGTEYAQLSAQLRVRTDQQVGRTGGAALFAQANNQANAQFAAGQPPAEGAKTLLRSFEGFKPAAYWDVNHWRAGYGSDTVTRADGSVVPVTQDTQVTRDDAERDLNRRTAEFSQRAETQLGAKTWAALTPQAQAALTSVTYNYGRLPDRVVAAAQSGNAEQIAAAVGSLSTDNGGINAGRRQAEAGIISGRGGYTIKGDAFRMALESNQFENEEQREMALHTISQLANAQEVAYNQSARARSEAINTTVGNYTTRFWDMLHTPNPDWVKFMGEINADSALADAGPAKDALMERVIKRSGEEQSLAFGPGYLTTKDRILSEPGTPGHIGDITEIYRLPLGSLTATGEHELIGIMGAIKKSPDEYGIQKTRSSLENYAKSVMAREQILPGFGTISTNKKGQEIFESQFIPQFNAAYANWTKAGKNPNEFLTKKNVDEMMDRIYPRSQRSADNMQSVGETNIPGAENQPLPPPPEGVEQKLWSGLISQPPLMPTGKIATPQQYGQAIKMLHDNPTPEMQAKFDKWFAAPNHGAKQILDTLAGKQAEKAEPPKEKEADVIQWPIYKLGDQRGPGPAGYLGEALRRVTPQKVQDYIKQSAGE